MSDSDNVIPLFGSGNETDKRRRMLEYWEAMYQQHGQTLTDPKTAASLHVAMAMMGLTLDGAHATGVITEEQRDTLAAFVAVGRYAADDWQK